MEVKKFLWEEGKCLWNSEWLIFTYHMCINNWEQQSELRAETSSFESKTLESEDLFHFKWLSICVSNVPVTKESLGSCNQVRTSRLLPADFTLCSFHSLLHCTKWSNLAYHGGSYYWAILPSFWMAEDWLKEVASQLSVGGIWDLVSAWSITDQVIDWKSMGLVLYQVSSFIVKVPPQRMFNPWPLRVWDWPPLVVVSQLI